VSTPLRALNVALALFGCLLVTAIGREMLTTYPLPPPPAPRVPRPVAAGTASTVSTTPPSAANHGVIAMKNLFSASRSEAPAGPVVAAGPKPLLHGVVMDGPKSRAYIEDALLKRTFSYGIGDTVGGGHVESIAADRVVIGRGDGLVEVLLRDPSKPRPGPAAAAPTPGTSAAAPGTPVPVTPTTSAPALSRAATGLPVPATQTDRR
jgi:hypothetical protein